MDDPQNENDRENKSAGVFVIVYDVGAVITGDIYESSLALSPCTHRDTQPQNKRTLGSSKDSTLRVSLKTNPDPAICPINLDSAAMAGATRVICVIVVAVGVGIIVVVLLLRSIVHAAVVRTPLTTVFQWLLLLLFVLLLFHGHTAVFITVLFSSSAGGGDAKVGIFRPFVVVVVVVPVRAIGWKLKDWEGHGTETKRSRNMD